MSKRTISFRLSDETLQALDRACARLKKSRSEAIDIAISVLDAEYTGDHNTLVRQAPWIAPAFGAEQND